MLRVAPENDTSRSASTSHFFDTWCNAGHLISSERVIGGRKRWGVIIYSWPNLSHCGSSKSVDILFYFQIISNFEWIFEFYIIIGFLFIWLHEIWKSKSKFDLMKLHEEYLSKTSAIYCHTHTHHLEQINSTLNMRWLQITAASINEQRVKN